MVDLPENTAVSNGHTMITITDPTGSKFGIRRWTANRILVSTMDENEGHAWNVEVTRDQALQVAMLLLSIAREMPSDP